MNEILRSIEPRFPSIAYTAISCEWCGFGEWFIKTKGGACYVYDEFEESIFHAARDIEELNEREYKMIFGHRLRKIMYWRNITQKELADKLDIYQSGVSKYVNGEKLPSIYMAGRIARALNCSLDDLLYFNAKGE